MTSNGNFVCPGAVTSGVSQGVYNSASCLGSNPPSWCGGATDIGQAVNAAFSAGGTGAHVWVPFGAYTYSHDISVPSVASGNYKLECAPGTVLNYTGSGYGIKMVPTQNVNGDSGNIVENCTVTGTSSGLAAFYLYAFSGAKLLHVSASGFTAGAGILNAGANTLDINVNQILGNKYGIHNVGTTAYNSPTLCFSANAVHVTEGTIGGNTQWGVYEDGTQSAATGTSCTVGPNQGNTYQSTFESNGTSGNSSTGNFFMQLCERCKIDGSYLEQMNSPTNVQIGDTTYQAREPSVISSYVYTYLATATSSINNVNSADADFADDQDDSYAVSQALPQLILQGAGTLNTTVKNYRAANLSNSTRLVGFSSEAPALGSFKNPAFGGCNDYGAYGDLTPPQSAPAVGTADGNVFRRGCLWIPGTTPVVLSPQTFTASSPWRILFIGVWIDDATAPTTTALPAYMERSSIDSTIVIDSYSTVTLSLNSSNQIQAVNSSTHNVTFMGTLMILGDNYNVAGSDSIDITGGIKVAGTEILPSTAAGWTGNSAGKLVMVQTGTTGSIGGSALAAGGCATGTISLSQTATGHPGIAAASDGSVQGNFPIEVSVSGTTATVSVCAITAGTPAAKTYNVTVF